MKIFLSLVLLLSVTASAFAVEAEINGLWYELVSKTKEATVIQYKNNVKYSGDIVIPEMVEYNGASYSVTSIGYQAFYYCSSLTSLTIPNNVKSIGGSAFWGCSGLISIIIPGSVTSIGGSAFYYCSSMTSVTIPAHVTSIGEYTFYGCSSMTSVTIGNGVTSIEKAAFCDCSNLTSITIPVSVTSIGSQAFYGCNKLTSVTIPGSVTSIGSQAFYGCGSLTSVAIPCSVTSIGEYTFFGCSSLKSITIPDCITIVGPYAFYGCSSLATVAIGNGVEMIYYKAFANCPELSDVYCYTISVPRMKDKFNRDGIDAFDGSLINFATLHVPTTSINAYKAVEPWASFKTIMGLDGTTPETKKCATPTISIVDGELEFSCETEGVEYVSEVTSKEVKKYYDSKVKIIGTYTVSVYATKDGYDNSDVATKEFTVGAGGDICDTNRDGTVDVADIATIIDKMAGK